MALKKFYVGVKGIIHEERGFLLLWQPKGYWDIPGGRIDGDEVFSDTLNRELTEELPGCEMLSIKELKGAFRLPKDIDGDTSLVLLYFLVEARLPKKVVLSDEHETYIWVNKTEDIPESDLNPEIRAILGSLVK